MTVFVVVQLSPKDPETLDRYFKVGGAAVKKHGGKPLAGGAGKRVIEANSDGRDGLPPFVLLEFPNEAAVDNWLNDPELAETHGLRRSGASTIMTLLPGF